MSTAAAPAAPPPSAPPTPAPAAPAPAPEAAAPAAEKKEPAERTEQLNEISDKLKNVFKDRLKGKAAAKEEKPAAEAKPAEKEATPEDNGKPAKPKEKDKEKEKEGTPPETKPEAKPTETKPTRVSRKAKTAEDQTIEAARAATEAAKATTEMILKQNSRTTPEAAAKDGLEKLLTDVPDVYKPDIPILKAMEERMPDKYKGLVKRYAEAAMRVQQYQRKWEEENRDKAFNPEEPEHDRFFQGNEVDWDERDYGRTLAFLETEPMLEKERENAKRFRDELEKKEALKEAEPAIRARKGEEAKRLITAIDKELLSLVNDQGEIIKSEYEKLDEKHPIAVDIVAQATRDLSGFVDLVERLFHPSGHFPFDEKNQTHVALAEYVLAKERQLGELPLADSSDAQGRSFATRKDYATMNKAEQDQYWQLGPSEIAALRRLEVVGMVKEATENGRKRMETVASRLGFIKAPASEAAPATQEAPAEEPAPAVTKPSSPAAAPAPKTDTVSGSVSPQSTDWRSVLKQKLRGHTVK